MRNRDKPWRIVSARDGMVLGFNSLERAEQHTQRMNQHAISRGHVHRYRVIRTKTATYAEEANENRCDRILEWLRAQPDGATKSQIGKEMGISSKNMNKTIKTLLESESIKHCKITAGNNAKYNGYQVTPT